MITEKRLIDANELLRDARQNKPISACLADIVDIQDLVNDQPTVDAVEVVHGRWEWITEDVYGCTNCGDVNHVKEVMGQPDWNYCPNCGAKMYGERRSDA